MLSQVLNEACLQSFVFNESNFDIFWLVTVVMLPSSGLWGILTHFLTHRFWLILTHKPCFVIVSLSADESLQFESVLRREGIELHRFDEVKCILLVKVHAFFNIFCTNQYE